MDELLDGENSTPSGRKSANSDKRPNMADSPRQAVLRRASFISGAMEMSPRFSNTSRNSGSTSTNSVPEFLRGARKKTVKDDRLFNDFFKEMLTKAVAKE
jgi:hypothetical protein